MSGENGSSASVDSRRYNEIVGDWRFLCPDGEEEESFVEIQNKMVRQDRTALKCPRCERSGQDPDPGNRKRADGSRVGSNEGCRRWLLPSPPTRG